MILVGPLVYLMMHATSEPCHAFRTAFDVNNHSHQHRLSVLTLQHSRRVFTWQEQGDKQAQALEPMLANARTSCTVLTACRDALHVIWHKEL